MTSFFLRMAGAATRLAPTLVQSLALLGVAAVATAAQPPDALGIARGLAAAGAPRLALNHADRFQPSDVTAPHWAEWELLRFDLLARLGRHQDLLARAEALPEGTPEPQLKSALQHAARAAAAAGKGENARRYASRLLWRSAVSRSDERELRLLVIETLAGDARGEDAFRSMLRFDQDFRPLEREIATRFAEALLDLGRAGDAVNWLAALEDDGPVKLRVRLAAGLVEPGVAVAQARAALSRQSDVRYWQVLAEAAGGGDRALRIEALEQILDLDGAADRRRRAAHARAVWKAYLDAVPELAGRHHLLSGDDAGWVAFVERRAGVAEPLGRALLAHLALHAGTAEARRTAQIRLVESLRRSRLDAAAARLFGDGGVEIGKITPQARRLLGSIAESRGMPGSALWFWEGLGAPPDADADEWHLRVAAVALRADRADAAAAGLVKAFAGRTAMAPGTVQRGSRLALEMLDAGSLDAADTLYTLLLPLAAAGERRHVLFGLGRINELGGRHAAAADHYMRAALLAGPGPDAHSLQARLAAAQNLARAGHREDARAQFEWVLRSGKDPTQLELARRALGGGKATAGEAR